MPRGCVFVGTTNEREYLKDETGGRRFWPIKCVEINLKAIERDREQLFAEAFKMFCDGESWWEVPKVAESIQENRRDADPWESAIIDWAENRKPFTMPYLLKKCLKVSIDKQNKGHSNRAGKILRSNGYKSKMTPANEVLIYVENEQDSAAQQISNTEQRVRAWFSPEKSYLG